MKKKILAIGLFLLAFGAGKVFAGDTAIFGGLDGSFSREDYEEQAADPDVALYVVEQLGAADITEFYQVTDDNADEYDNVMMEDLAAYIKANCKVKNNEGYSFIAIESQTDDSLSGWIVFYHYSKKADPKELYYVYYFAVEM